MPTQRRIIDDFREGDSIANGDVRRHLNKILDLVRQTSKDGAAETVPYGTFMPTQPVRTKFRWFKVTAAAPVAASNDTNGNPTQWIYTASEAYKSDVGYAAWTVKAAEDGFTGNCYNFSENTNDGTGVQGNGIDHDGSGYPSTFSMQPIPIPQFVPGYLVSAPDGAGIALEAWVNWVNGEDGECS